MSSKVVEANAGVHSLAMAVAVSHAKTVECLSALTMTGLHSP